MNLNQFTYYRANPYVHLGYMPPTALINRHKPQYFGQLPMGEQHLQKIGRKQFNTNIHKSQIQTQNILASPQRYPYQNRIALDKEYERNLSTIDIEGASGGTLVSKGVRNKIKARQFLNQRVQKMKESENDKGKVWEPIKTGETYEQERRKKVAYEHYLKFQHLKQLKTKQENNPQNQSRVQKNEPSTKINERTQGDDILSRYYIKNRGHPSSQQNLKPRYQSIDYSRLQQIKSNRASVSNHNRNKSLVVQTPRELGLSSQNSPLLEPYSPQSQRSRVLIYQKLRPSKSQNTKQTPLVNFPTDKKSLRLFNPTNLSTESSISLAARNIINNK